MAKLEFKCDKCGKLLKVEAVPGEQVLCSHCASLISVPRVMQSSRAAPQMAGAVPMPVGLEERASAVVVEEAPEAEEGSSALAAMSVLMPWALSIVFHIGILLIMAFIAFLGPNVLAEDPDDPLVKLARGEKVRIPEAKLVQDPGSKVVNPDAQFSEQWNPEGRKDLEPPPEAIMMEVTGGGQSGNKDLAVLIGVLGSGPGAIAAGGSGKGTDISDLVKGGYGEGARFFGTQSGGNCYKIVYVVDSSGSMNFTFPYVKEELKRSIRDLQDVQQFQVIFFSDGPPTEMVIGAAKDNRLYDATPNNIRAALAWIDAQRTRSTTGETNPQPGMKSAFEVVGGPPELVYFLTDGLFPNATVETIRRLNPKKQVLINTILFRDHVPEAARLLRQIAEENGGRFKFISETELGSMGGEQP